MHHTSGEQRATGRDRGRDILAPEDHHDAGPQRPGTHDVSRGKEPYRDYAKGTFAGSMPGYTASRGLRSNPCDVCVSAVEPAGLPKGIDVAGTARRRWTGEPVRADADGDGAGRRQHRRETMATPDHRGQNPMMFAQLEPIQAKAEGTFAGSTPSSGAGRGLPCAAKPRMRCNPRCRLLQRAVELATTELAFEDVKARTLIGSE